MAAAGLLFSCSTTRVLKDDQYRLAKNKILITNDRSFSTNDIEPYIKQKPIGWNPFMYIYNWSRGTGSGWDRFVERIGVAPVVYDPDMVES